MRWLKYLHDNLVFGSLVKKRIRCDQKMCSGFVDQFSNREKSKKPLKKGTALSFKDPVFCVR